MKEQLHWGKAWYVSFILLDIICFVAANLIAANVYFNLINTTDNISDYMSIVIIMIVIDVFVTLIFDTLKSVLRRGKRKEAAECLKQIVGSFVLLALVLFSTKQGATYSRATVYLAYGIYYLLLVVSRTALKCYFRKRQIGNKKRTALLITTSGYAEEGLSVIERFDIEVKAFFITDLTNEGIINNIPVLVDRKDVLSFLCWEWIDDVYICGPKSIDPPETVLKACRQMGIPIHTAANNNSFEYEVIKIRTALQKDDKATGLSFFEGEHDIPFRISRLYTIYGSEQAKQTGFYPFKQSWHFFFCPYGEIDVFIDTGKEKTTITLDNPSIGLMLHPSIWREIYWKSSGSVLCVAASGHYDTDTLNSSYDSFLRFLQEKDWAATIEYAEIMGEELS